MKINDRFFDDLTTSPGVTNLTVGIAQQIAGDARSTAPVGATGKYRDGIHVELKHQRRSVALVVASDPKSLLIESRTGNLVRALQRAKKRHRG